MYVVFLKIFEKAKHVSRALASCELWVWTELKVLQVVCFRLVSSTEREQLHCTGTRGDNTFSGKVLAGLFIYCSKVKVFDLRSPYNPGGF